MNYLSETEISQVRKSNFLITGGAGFIGSNLVDHLMKIGAKKVRVFDNLSTGYRKNLEQHEGSLNFEFIEGDIRDKIACEKAMVDIDFVSHQAALGSVPRSISDPVTTHEVNSSGFLNVLLAAKNSEVTGFVFASSSSVYGDSIDMPKVETKIGNPLSPYAVTKFSNELYARSFGQVYSFFSTGLRYFNVFGPKQNPNSQYSAVIPLFIKSLILNTPPLIHGDGLQSRDFTYIDNVVQANIKALLNSNNLRKTIIINIAVGESTSLLSLWDSLTKLQNSKLSPIFSEARIGDVKNSQADISLAIQELNYKPTHNFDQGIQETWSWYKQNLI